MPPKRSNIDENNRKITKLVVYKTIKTLSYIEFMLNDKKQASQFILKIFELAGLFVSLGVPLNKIRLNGKMENYPVMPTDQYLTSRTQNTPALPYFSRSSLSSSTMPLSSE